HLARGCARPCRRHRQVLQCEAGVFRPPQRKERIGTRHHEQQHGKQRDRPFANGKRRKIQVHPPIPPSADVLTDAPSCRRCAPRATTGSSVLRPETTAYSLVRRTSFTGLKRTVEEAASKTQTPVFRPSSRMAPSGTCTSSSSVSRAKRIVTVAPSGALAATPSSV